MVYRVEYLQWYVLYNDMTSTRKLFSNLTRIQPDCKKLYMTMIDYEKLEAPVNVVTIKDLYNVVCSRFGQQENDISECIFIISILYYIILRSFELIIILSRCTYFSVISTTSQSYYVLCTFYYCSFV